MMISRCTNKEKLNVILGRLSTLSTSLSLYPKSLSVSMKNTVQFLFSGNCQCPSGLHPHFYECNDNGRAGLHQVSMPWRASSPFLPESQTFKLGDEIMCQCPGGLHLHFYCYLLWRSFRSKNVSMPWRASSPFLR